MMASYAHFFEIPDQGKNEGICKVCREKYGKHIVVNFSSTSKTNLKSHFNMHHKDIDVDTKARCHGSSTIDQHFNPQPFVRQEELTNAVADMIVDLNQPLKIVERPKFRRVLAVATSGRYKPVSYKTIRERIIRQGNSWIFQPTRYKEEFGKPSTTVDIWSSRARRGYMAVSLHTNTKTGLETHVLDLAHIPSPHTGENIKRKYDEILQQHGLDPSDTFKVVCDNASNMKKAFRVSLWEDENDEDEVEAADDENIFDVEDPLDDDLVQDIDGIDFATMFEAQYRQPCSIHSLQLFVKDCIRALPQRYQNVLKKAKVASSKLHHSTKLSESMSKQLPTPGETRWNGQYRLLNVLLREFDEVQLKIGGFVNSDVEIVKSLVSFFKPFYNITKQLESEKKATIHEVIPLFCFLERHILTVDQSAPFKEAIITAFEKRFAFMNTDMHLLSAVVLSQHGYKWLPKAQESNRVLKFESVETLSRKVLGYIGAVVDDIGLDTDQAVAPPPAKAQKTDENDSMYGYDDPEILTDKMSWKTVYENHLTKTTTLPKNGSTGILEGG